MIQTELQRWVIAGQGVAAWMAAAVLANNLDTRVCSIVICGSEGAEPVAKQQAMLPHFLELLAALGADRESFIWACRGHYKLADRLCDWQGQGSNFFHATGDYGANLGAIEFVQALGRLRAEGAALAPLEAYSLAATCAQSGKFVPSATDRSSILSSFQYGCSLSVPDLIDWLKAYCLQRGVTFINSAAVQVQASNDGIESVCLENGETVTGDFFVDTSEEALLRNRLGSKAEDWSNQLLSNVAFHLNSDQSASAPVVTLSGMESGWEKRVSSAGGTTLSFYGREQELTLETTEIRRQADLGSPASVSDVRPQVRKNFWVANCLALGSAAIGLPSPALSDLDLSWLALNQLLKHFPMLVRSPMLSEEYNRVMMEVYERCRDLTQMYFLAADQHRGNFWRDSAGAGCSEELKHKMRLFRSRGRIPFYEHEVFNGGWQTYLLLGLGVWPEKVDPLAWQADPDRLIKLSKKVQAAVAQMAGQLPEHETYLQQEGRKSMSARSSGE